MVLSPPFPGLSRTSLVAHMVTRLPTVQETRVQSLGWEDLLEKEMATHSSILAWKIPWMEEPGGLQFMGSQRVGHEEQLNFLGLISPISFYAGTQRLPLPFCPSSAPRQCSCPRKEEKMKPEVRRPSHHRRLPLKFNLETGWKIYPWTQLGQLGTPAQAGLKVCSRTESLCYAPETNMTW